MSQQRYLITLVQTGIVRQSAIAAGVEVETISNWRAPSHPNSQMFNACEQAIRGNLREYSLAAAKQELEHSAALTAHRMVETATAPDDGPRTMPTRQRARETILEAVGIIQRAPAVALQVNNQAMDPAAVRALIERLEREREALMEQKRLHNGAPALSAGKETAIDASSGTT